MQDDLTPEAVAAHLDLSQNHEAGLIPVATQILLRAMSARLAEVTGERDARIDPEYVEGMIKSAAPILVDGYEAELTELRARAEASERALATAERARDCFQRMTRAHWEALCAMRNSINEYVPMPNTDSGPLFSPENGPIYADIAERVVSALSTARAAPMYRIFGTRPADEDGDTGFAFTFASKADADSFCARARLINGVDVTDYHEYAISALDAAILALIPQPQEPTNE